MSTAKVSKIKRLRLIASGREAKPQRVVVPGDAAAFAGDAAAFGTRSCDAPWAALGRLLAHAQKLRCTHA